MKSIILNQNQMKKIELEYIQFGDFKNHVAAGNNVLFYGIRQHQAFYLADSTVITAKKQRLCDVDVQTALMIWGMTPRELAVKMAENTPLTASDFEQMKVTIAVAQIRSRREDMKVNTICNFQNL